MFIYSMRASSVKFFSVIALTLAVLVGLLVFGRGDGGTVYASSADVDFSGIKTEEDRVRFISQFDIKVKGEPVETEEFRVPDNFDRVIAGYNEIQKKQGLDLEIYKGVRVKSWSYEITNYPGYENSNGTIRGNLLIYNGVVVGGDVSNIELGGFMHTFFIPSEESTDLLTEEG